MKNSLNAIFRLAIAQSLTNREEFVEKVGSFIQEKTGKNVADSEKYGEYIMNLLENLNDELLINQILNTNGTDQNDKLGNQIEELTKAIKELSNKIDKYER
jgi:hypothetical protein